MQHLQKIYNFTSDKGQKETDLGHLFVLEDLESLCHLYPHRT